jgi:hypothetical protein
MVIESLTTHQKALQINLDAGKFGTFAEIGAGQEVVRWFFHVGRAAATVAKSISAYDTVVSDELYGATSRYVSRTRIEAMLDHEYPLLIQRLDQKHGEKDGFFVFADTVTTHGRRGTTGGHGWLGIRFQAQPKAEPSQILLHVQLLDTVTTGEQDALGILGVNLIYGAFYYNDDPSRLVRSLTDGLRRDQIDVDLIKFSGPAFAGVDNRLMALLLVEKGLTHAAMFTAQGEVVQPSEILWGQPVILERGAFRPVTNVVMDMIDGALIQIRSDPAKMGEPITVMEMSLNNLMTGAEVDREDFLARADTLASLGKMVMISDYTRFDLAVSCLRKYTNQWIVMLMGVPTLREVLDRSYYESLEGGILEGLSRLFQKDVSVYVYPARGSRDEELETAAAMTCDPTLKHVYAHFLENGFIQDIAAFREDQLHVRPSDVLAKIQNGDASWESLVPAPAIEIIKKNKHFGYRAG